ncbi:hypothetical protein Tsubulata_020981 [Turnera subulata]|uniref:Thiaminase-2/PQQC domain-containing protein n=1 Tax=Turnera subulata TaxID=218843 RepID=A0A9Q0FTB5_9ROSI|nr:hypothetical protein Tsubulata_020981 [Turnera subulata]
MGTNYIMEGTMARLWKKHHGESMFAMYTPFVLCLASGNLQRQSFNHYIAQDIPYLIAYAQACELAEKCSDDDDDAKRALSKLKNGAIDELHTLQEWEIDKENYPMHSATQKYMDFLLANASGKVEGIDQAPFKGLKLAAYTLGAMMPCLRLYAFLGKELEALLGPEDVNHPYKKWIDRNSSEFLLEDILLYEAVVDKLNATLTDNEIGIIGKLYHQAMELEIEFFLAQPLYQPTVVPLTKQHNPLEDHLLIFCDFDQTCTEVVDSCAVLAEIANLAARKHEHQDHRDDEFASTTPLAVLRAKWDHLVAQYKEEYEQCISSITCCEKVAFSYEAVHEALEKFSDLERRGNSRVIESKVFKGLSLEHIKAAGERIPFQDGCTSFFEKLLKKENLYSSVHIISLCWCADLIRSAFSPGGLDALNVHANEFFFEDSVSTGEILRSVESPADKVQTFNNIVRSYSAHNRRNLTVYVGDSIGDLLCLLQADIGIVVGSSSGLRRVATQLGISFVPLYSALVRKQKENIEGTSFNWKSLSGVLYTVTCWAEIDAFILGW